MSLNTELITQLQKLTTLEPSLIQELKNVKSVETGAEAVMAAARRHDVAVDARELANLLQDIGAPTPKGELSDKDLESVAGGFNLWERLFTRRGFQLQRQLV